MGCPGRDVCTVKERDSRRALTGARLLTEQPFGAHGAWRLHTPGLQLFISPRPTETVGKQKDQHAALFLNRNPGQVADAKPCR